MQVLVMTLFMGIQRHPGSQTRNSARPHRRTRRSVLTEPLPITTRTRFLGQGRGDVEIYSSSPRSNARRTAKALRKPISTTGSG